MIVSFTQSSVKKRRWLVCLHGYHSALSYPIAERIERIIFERFECRVIRSGGWGSDFVKLTIELKNDPDQAAFVLWASGGVEVQLEDLTF